MREPERTTSSSAGRPREFDQNEALGKIMSVFWEKGYEGTSLSNLTAATGVRRASLYKAFGDKRAMYQRALERYEAQFVDTACERLAGSDKPAERLNWFLTLPAEDRWRKQDPRGCFLCNASADQASQDEVITTRIREGRQKLVDAIAGPVAALRADLNTSDVAAKARFLFGVYTGLRILARSGASEEMLGDIRAEAVTSLQESKS